MKTSSRNTWLAVLTLGVVIVLASVSLLRGGEAKGQSCEPLSQRDEPRLNLRLDPDLADSTGQCALTMTAYIQTRASVDTIVGSVEASPSEAQGQRERFVVKLEPSPTGMKSGEFDLAPVAAPFCSGVVLSATIEQCLTPEGAPQSCPPVRFVDADTFGRVEILNPGSTACYD